jgi:hypothetical protein
LRLRSGFLPYAHYANLRHFVIVLQTLTKINGYRVKETHSYLDSLCHWTAAQAIAHSNPAIPL